MNKILDVLVKVAGKIDSNKFLKNIKDSLLTLLPLIIVGSFASLFKTVCTASWFFDGKLADAAAIFNSVSFACVTCMTIVLVFLIGYLMAKSNKIEPLHGALVAFASYIVTVPSFTTIVVGEDTQVVNNVLGSNYLGAAGMLIALIVGILAVQLLTFLMRIEKIKIHMPKEVPPMIAKSFNVLIPMAITIIVMAAAGYATLKVSGSYLPDLFYTLIQKPLEHVAQTPGAAVFIVFLTQLLWFLGIHGGMATRAIRAPFLVAGLAGNIAAVEAGGVAANFFTETFWQTFVVFGGTGCCFSLLITVFVFSKRKDYREIAKLGFIPSVFGINEPIIYGLPIVLNPIIGIPFIIAPCVTALLGWFFTSIAFVPCATVELPAGLPVFVNALVGYPGSIKALIGVFICFVVSIVIYAPFVIAANKLENKVAE